MVTAALWPRAALGCGWEGALTGAASQAHTPGHSAVVLAAAVGGLGAVWGSRGGQRGQGGACGERQGAQRTGMATCPLWAWPQHLSLLGRHHSTLLKPTATRTGVPGARGSGEEATPLTQTHLRTRHRNTQDTRRSGTRRRAQTHSQNPACLGSYVFTDGHTHTCTHTATFLPNHTRQTHTHRRTPART